MLQVPNIIKNPYIWIPPTVASAVCGALSSTVFGMVTTSVGAGMGTSGLVGQVATFSVMGQAALLPMALLHFALPAALCLALTAWLCRTGKILPGDLSL